MLDLPALPRPNISEMKKDETFYSSSTTFSDSPRPVLRYLHCSDVFRQLWVTNLTWHLRWERCKKEFGTVYTKMSDAEIKQWASLLPPLGKQWAAARDKAGQPGTAILKAWMDEMRAKNQPVARNWDVN